MEMALSEREEALREGMSEKYIHKKLIKIHFPRSRVGNVNNKELIASQDN